MTGATSTSGNLYHKVNFTYECVYDYVFRHLAGEIASEWSDMTAEDEADPTLKDKLVLLARQIVPYNMQHNAEAEACDLLMEIERLDILDEFVDENAYPRVCLYLTR